jgi:hypothetical protein
MTHLTEIIIIALGVITLLGHGIWVGLAAFFRWLTSSAPGQPPEPQRPKRVEVTPSERRAYAEMEINRLVAARLLSEEHRARIDQAFQELDRLDQEPKSRPTVAVGVNAWSQRSEEVPPPLPEPIPPPPVRVAAPEQPPKPVGPTWSEVIATFMESRHIRWGEVIGGLLIVLCSTALVVSFWSDISSIPWVKFSLFTGITAAGFGVAWFMEKRWHFPMTARVTATIAHLLVPLNFLMVAAFHAAGSGDLVSGWLGQILALGLLGWLSTRTAPFLAGRFWRGLSVSVMANSAVMLVIERSVTGESPIWLFGVFSLLILAVWWLPEFWPSSGSEAGGSEDSWRERLTVAGISFFGLCLAMVFLMTRHDDGVWLSRQLAPIFTLGSVPFFLLGIRGWNQINDQTAGWLRVTVAAIGAGGVALLVIGQVHSSHQPLLFVLLALLNAGLLAWTAWQARVLELAYPVCGLFAIGVVGSILWGQGGFASANNSPLNLAQAFLSGPSLWGWSVALAFLGGALVWFKRQEAALPERWWSSRPFILSTAALAVVQVGLALWHGWSEPSNRGSFWILAMDALVVLGVTVRFGGRSVAWAGGVLTLLAIGQGVTVNFAPMMALNQPWQWAGLLTAFILLPLGGWGIKPSTVQHSAAASALLTFTTALAGILLPFALVTMGASGAGEATFRMAGLLTVFAGLTLVKRSPILCAGVQVVAALALVQVSWWILGGVISERGFAFYRHPLTLLSSALALLGAAAAWLGVLAGLARREREWAGRADLRALAVDWRLDHWITGIAAPLLGAVVVRELVPQLLNVVAGNDLLAQQSRDGFSSKVSWMPWIVLGAMAGVLRGEWGSGLRWIPVVIGIGVAAVGGLWVSGIWGPMEHMPVRLNWVWACMFAGVPLIGALRRPSVVPPMFQPALGLWTCLMIGFPWIGLWWMTCLWHSGPETLTWLEMVLRLGVDRLGPGLLVVGTIAVWGGWQRSPWVILMGWAVAQGLLALSWFEALDRLGEWESGALWILLLPAAVVLMAVGQSIWYWLDHRFGVETGERHPIARSWHRIAAAFVASVFFLAGAGALFFEPTFPGTLLRQAGHPLSWIALAGLVVAYVLGLKFGEYRSHLVHLLGLGGMMVIAFAGSCQPWGAFSWLSYNVMTVGAMGLAAMPFLLQKWGGGSGIALARRPDGTFADFPKVSVIMTAILLLIMLRRMVDEGVLSWWPVAGGIAVAALAGATTWQLRSPGWCGWFALAIQFVGGLVWWKLNQATGWPDSAAFWFEWMELEVILLSLTGGLCLLLREVSTGEEDEAKKPWMWSWIALGGALALLMLNRTTGISVHAAGFSTGVGAVWPVFSWLAVVALVAMHGARVRSGPAWFLTSAALILAYLLPMVVIDVSRLSWVQALWGWCFGSGLVSVAVAAFFLRREMWDKRLSEFTRLCANQGENALVLVGMGMAVGATGIALPLILTLNEAMWGGLVLNAFWARIGLSVFIFCHALGLVLICQRQPSLLLRVGSWLTASVAVLLGTWAVMPVESEPMSRCVAAMLAITGILGVIAWLQWPRALRETEWRQAGRWSGLMLLGLWIGTAVGLLSLDGWMLAQEIKLANMVLAASILPFLGLSALAVLGALNRLPGYSPVPDSWREPLVYLAEIVLGLLFIHLRLSAPWLFGGVLQDYWPLIVMLLAFGGVGCGHAFARTNSPLPQPLIRTGLFLPLIPVLGFCSMESRMDYEVVLFLAGLAYGGFALVRRSWWLGGVSALAANGALWVLLNRSEGFSFFEHPQLWLIPGALAALIGGHLNRDRLNPATLTGLRYGCLTVIYASSSADLFIHGVAGSFWLPIILGGLSLLGIGAGMVLRIRAFLLLGALFLTIDLLAIIWHASSNLGWTWIWYLVGLCAGIAIVVVFALFEKKREEALSAVKKFRQWDP